MNPLDVAASFELSTVGGTCPKEDCIKRRNHVGACGNADDFRAMMRKSRAPWANDDASRTYDPREDEGRSYPNRNAHSNGAEEGNDGWSAGRAAGCNE